MSTIIDTTEFNIYARGYECPDIRPYNYGPKSSKTKYRANTEKENMFTLASAIRKGRELAILFKRPLNGPLWPVIWGEKGDAFLYTPRPDGVLFTDVQDNPYRLCRSTAILLLNPQWYQFDHWGAVPGLRERSVLARTVSCDVMACDSLTRAVADYDLDPAETQDSRPGGGSGYHCAMLAVARDKLISWLLDSGASDHFAGKNVLGKLIKHKKVASQPLQLTCANGIAVADECIDMVIESLNDQQTVFVMPI